MSATQTIAQLLELLATLPTDSNPYTAISDVLSKQVFALLPSAFPVLLWVSAVVLGIAGVLILVSLVIRARKGQFWLVRLQASPLMLRPHATCSWATLALALVAVLEALIVFERQYYAQVLNRQFGYWMLLPWCGGWFAGHIASWTLVTSFVLHLQSTKANFPAHTFAMISNIYGLATPVFYTAVFLPCALLGGKHYEEAMKIFAGIETLLDESASTWTAGQPFSVLSLAPALPLLTNLEDQVGRFVFSFRFVFGVYAFSATSLVVILITIAYLYLSSLKSMLSNTREFRPHDAFDSHTESTPRRRRTSQEARVHRTLRSLMWTIISFSVLGVVFTGSALLGAISPLALISSSTRASVVFLTPLAAFSTFGLIASVILVLRALDITESEETTAKSSGSKNKKSHTPRSQQHPSSQFSVQLAPLSGLAGVASVGATPLDEMNIWFDLQVDSSDSSVAETPRLSGATSGLDAVHVTVESFIHVDEGEGKKRRRIE